MRTHIRLLAPPKSMSLIIDATQRELWHSQCRLDDTYYCQMNIIILAAIETAHMIGKGQFANNQLPVHQ
jgi:hypothetical protein